MKNYPKTIVWFAAPGGGKDMQSGLLRGFFKQRRQPFLYVGTGEEFREIKKPNYTLDLISETIKKGELVPNFLAESIVGSSLLANLDPEKHLIINGFPRNESQCQKLYETMEFYGRSATIIFISIAPEEAIRRISQRGESRPDDKPEAVKKRFEIFEKENAGLVECFRAHSSLHPFVKIDGSGKPEDVHRRILLALGLT